jgi:hypothetical protein
MGRLRWIVRFDWWDWFSDAIDVVEQCRQELAVIADRRASVSG